MKTLKIVYWVLLALFTAMILTSIWNYIFHFEETLVQFQILGYPSHLIHPLVVAQFLGLVIMLSNKGKWLIEWAYAGFFMNMVFAIIAHYVTAEGNGAAAVLGLLLLFTIYILNKRLKYMREVEIKEPVSATVLASS